MGQKLIVGVGNKNRADDAAGLLVADDLEGNTPPGVAIEKCSGEPGELIDYFEEYSEIFLVDALKSTDNPGQIHRINVKEEELPAQIFPTSTHSFGVYEAVELARKLQELPDKLIIYGITGGEFEIGGEVTPAVSSSVAQVVDQIRAELEE